MGADDDPLTPYLTAWRSAIDSVPFPAPVDAPPAIIDPISAIGEDDQAVGR
ncbi:hypothetical protein GCM10017786_03040 [Amycolatopsis deserti]|uniref:Uncharacterized protein n=1 Tax=Amycolatopsis deserti TaxID=185696 RepID=A0ABQ3IBJ2_9PSEU|nr:hypothetical protein [Amycolatopsis deserti]GHE77132.1 hypothetical protein GCM10017786_03040 [Amycolatopsis deserti]